MSHTRIHLLTSDQLNWSFDGQDHPTYYLDTKPWGNSVKVDAFPCYHHDMELVEKEVVKCETRIPLPFPPEYFILSNECLSRTNGFASEQMDYEDNKNPKLIPYIVLHGKRIPIMPNMTRYLVCHEYSHVVEFNIRKFLTIEANVFQKEYAEFRGVNYDKSYGAGKWHLNIQEIIANDIRVAILESEIEFWPHIGVDNPFKNTKIIDYWNNYFEKLKK